MGWRLRIRHHTGFRYSGPVRASYNEARLTPLTLPTQTTLDSRIEIKPGAAASRYWDYWGSHVTSFDIQEPHDVLEVIGMSVVETTGATDPGDLAGWDVVGAENSRDKWVELLAPTARTEVPERAAIAVNHLAKGLEPHAAAVAISDYVRSNVEYVPGSTQVQTSAVEAYEQGQGVCQDIAHLAVGLLRRQGIPARYVSGYLHPQHDAAIGSAVAGQSHAWVEWWAGRWVAYDPTNGVPVGERHVTVARGRDYSDVPPLKGIYHGSASTGLGVEVEITRLA